MDGLRRFVSLAYLPTLWIGLGGTALFVLATGAPLAWLAALLLLAIALSFAAERIAPFSREWNRSHDDGLRDVAHAVVNEATSVASLASLPWLVAWLGTGRNWPAELPFLAQVLGALLVLDVGVSLAHFASHRLGWLWRIHAVHHSVRRMYGFNGLMKHPLHQSVEMLAGTAPLVAMGLPLDVGLALVFCTALQLLLQHSNVDHRVGALRHVLAVAEVHRFHHRKWPEEGDVNFGLFTTVVDHCLGTYHWEAESPRSSDAIGIGAEPDYPDAYLAQLLQPFRAGRNGAGQPATSS